ncbi:MAG: hypothetical protein ACR2N7_09290 [Acidimicrobiia bacterium]
MSEPYDVVRQLAAIQDRLIALPDDAFAERWELRKEQDNLRKKAAAFAYALDEDKFDDELLSELEALRGRMRSIEKQRIDLVMQSGSGGSASGEMSSLGAVKINKAMDDASGLPAIKARIGVIKGVLINRDVEIPEAD